MAADSTHQGTGLQRRQGGATALPSGGSLDIESGAAFKIAGTDVTAILAAALAGVAAGYKVARGVDAVTGTLNKATGLATVVACVAVLKDDPSLAAMFVSVAAHATPGTVVLKVWKPTGAGDTTPIAGAAPANVAWIAVGT